MASWNLKELRFLVASYASDNQLGELIKFTDSFDWKSKALYYHYYTAEQSVAPFENLELADVSKKIIASEESICLAIKTREISLVSAVLVAVALPEVLAQVINIALCSSDLHKEKLDCFKVWKSMGLGDAKDEYGKIIKSESYKYLRAFANVSKHLSLVHSEYHISYEAGVHGVRFKRFFHKSDEFPGILDQELIAILKALRTECVDFGSKINEAAYELHRVRE